MSSGEPQKTVVLETSMGEIEVEFYPDFAPRAVENFVTLVGRKYGSHPSTPRHCHCTHNTGVCRHG